MHVFQVVGRLTAYAALGVILVAPLVAAFRGTRGRQTGAQAITPGPPGVVHMAHEYDGQLDMTRVGCPSLHAIAVGHCCSGQHGAA